MTYISQETSRFEGQPFELFRFSREAQVFLYTSADRDIIFNNETYTSIPIEREEFEQTQDLAKSTVRINLDGAQLLPRLYIATSPSQSIGLTIFSGHEGDPANEIIAIWKGRIISLSHANNRARIDAESIITSLRRNGLRRLYQRNCPYQLYDGATCRVNRNDFRVLATLNAVDGVTVSSAQFGSLAADQLTGGFLLWNAGNFTERRWITQHSGTDLTLRRPIPDLSVGAEVETFAGCDRTLNTCNVKFNNIENYGGMPWIPPVNPFAENVF